MNLALLLLIMLCALALTGIAHSKHVQPALVIVTLASAASFVPGLPRLQLEPEVILTVVVPPLLYSAAYGTSVGQFMRNLQPIVALGVMLVAVSTLVVGYVVHWLLPSLSLGAAFVLASVVAPPDTVTAVSHGHELGLTRRVQSILMGESLVNDATALTLFALAMNAVSRTHMVSDNPVLLFLYQAVVGVVVGAFGGMLGNVVRSKMKHPKLEVALAFILPFAAYLVAEHVHASGILAVVMAAFSVSVNTFYDPRAIHQYTYRTRLKEREFWGVVDALLEAFVFAYMGLQLRSVLEALRASGEPFGGTLVVGAAVLVILAALRLAWTLVFFHPRLVGWIGRRRAAHDRAMVARGHTRRRRGPLDDVQLTPLTWQENSLIGWTGMRGIITLAAAGGVPIALATGEPFPGRAVIQTVAFFVTVGSLVIQGGTLAAVSRRLGIDLTDDLAQERDEMRAAYQIAKTAPADDFPMQRRTLGQALREHRVNEATTRAVMLSLDLEQAARSVTTEAAASE